MMRKNSITKNLIYALFDKFARMFISFLLVAYIARNLTKDEFGILNYGLTISSLAITFTWIISADIIVKMLSQFNKLHHYIIDTAFWSRIAFSLVVFIAYILYGSIGFNGTDRIVLLLFSFAILFNPFSIIHSYFRYKANLTEIIKLDLIFFLIISALKFIVLYYTGSIILLASMFVFEYLASAIIFIYLYKNKNKYIQFNFTVRLLKKMISLGWPLFLSASISVLFLKIDRIMIAELSNTSRLADYFVATNLTEVWWSIPTIFVQVISVKMIYQSSRTNLASNYNLVNKIISLFFVITTTFTLFFSANIIKFVYGDKFIESSNILNIYMLCSIFVFWDLLNTQILIKNNNTKLILYKSIIGLFCNTILSYFLIKKFDILGAAIGTLISYMLCWLYIVLSDKTIRTMAKIQIFSIINPFMDLKSIKTLCNNNHD